MISIHTQYLAPVKLYTVAQRASPLWFQTTNTSWCRFFQASSPSYTPKCFRWPLRCCGKCSVVSGLCDPQRLHSCAEASDASAWALSSADLLFRNTSSLWLSCLHEVFHVSSEQREERAQPELTSCFCFATLRNVNDCANICSKFPF